MSFSRILHSTRRAVGNGLALAASKLGQDPFYLPNAGDLLRSIDRFVMRHYDAASTTRIRNDWGTTTDSPRSDIRSDLTRVIARSRMSADNDGLSSNIDNVFLSNIVHTGIRPKAVVKEENGDLNEDANRNLNEGWKRYNDQWDRSGKGTYYESQRLGLRTIINSGSVLTNRVPSRKGDFLPIANQLIEPDRLAWEKDTFNTRHTDATPKRSIQFGMELDRYGVPERFHLKGMSKPFEAGNMDIRYVRRRPEQYIGVPWKAPVLKALWDLDNLLEDNFIAWRIRAMISMWVDKHDAPTLLNPARVDSDNRIKWEPARIMYSGHEPKIIESKSNVTDTFDPFTRLMQRSIAIGTGLSYQILTKDLQGMNFASSRANILEDRRIFRLIQSWFIKEFCQRDWETFVFWMFVSGEMAPLTLTDYNEDPWKWAQCYWRPPGWQWVDPLKDSKAAISLHQNNMLSLDEHYGSQGKDWEAEIMQIAKEKKEIKRIETEYGVSMEPIRENQFGQQEGSTTPEETIDGSWQ